MSRHVLVVSLDSEEQARLDTGELVFPEDVERHKYSIMCPGGNGCSGWLECREPHEVDGVSADCGPYRCACPAGQRSQLGGVEEPLAPWHDCEDFTFHGVEHTWRAGHGWTVPYPGCIVNWCDYELPAGYGELPLGEHEVDDDWDDTECYLTLAEPVAAR
ncbi:Uncharacterised protein [Mycobacteroides abscessus subsp. abscessus]|jgi:hypothetical protein|uniref:hypothetical protein n=1 Tax=Mycobacteroides abscessus TaxID=36809 RepID=UPI000926DD2D|nr:hypothetical protein [Mycobacteroides abscessus]SIH38516.1 Uncharacterised protein [Mycobacteroides abscessus subsp. abscessus]